MMKAKLVSGSSPSSAVLETERLLTLGSLQSTDVEKMGKSQHQFQAIPALDDVTKALERILASQEFRNKCVLKKFLNFVVDKTLSGQSNEIKGYTIATQVFGRAVDFDANLDPIVRIQAGRLRRAIERYYLNEGKEEPIRIEISKGGYVPTFRRHSRDKRLEALSGGPSVVEEPVLTFLPIANPTNDSGHESLIDGLIQELTFELSRCHDLHVIDTRLTPEWRGSTVAEGSTCRDANVRFLLAGSIRKEEQQVKVTLQLIDLSTRLQVWGEQYRYEMRDEGMICLQEKIARSVAGRIGGTFGIVNEILYKESRGKSEAKLTLHECFLRFYRYLRIASGENFSRAFEAMKRAVSRDPECGRAWSMLALLYAHNHTLRLIEADTPLDDAMAYARKGVQLERQSHYAWLALSFLYFLLGERDLSLDGAHRAIHLNPNASDTMGLVGFEMALNGEWEQGLMLLEESMGLNPSYPGWLHLAPSLWAYRERAFEKAYEEAQKCQTPCIFMDPLLRAAALGQLDRKQQARRAVDEILKARPDFPGSHRSLLGYYVKEPELVELIIEGLAKAGLGPPSSSRACFAVPTGRAVAESREHLLCDPLLGSH